MKKLVALTLIFILLLTGCSTPAADKDKDQPADKGDVTNNDNPATENAPPTPSDVPTVPEESTSPSDIPVTPSDTPIVPDELVLPDVITLDSLLAEDHSDTTQVILVLVEDYSSTACVLKIVEKIDGKWAVKHISKGYVGYKGSADGEERRQGSLKTPLGIYKILSAMGIAEDPGTIFPYTQIKEGMYWDLNSDSPTYNRLVYSDPGGDREVLWKMGAQYNYVLNTSYNEDQTKDKGGAIFIHASKNEPTAGCISIPEEDMKKLIKWVDPTKNPVLFSCLNADVPVI